MRLPSIFFVLIFAFSAIGWSSPEDEIYFETLSQSCKLLPVSNKGCFAKDNQSQILLNTLQASCLQFRKQNGCDDFETELLKKADEIANPRQKYAERALVKSKIPGCDSQRICESRSSTISCFRGGLEGVTSIFTAIPQLALMIRNIDSSILNSTSKEILEMLKSELGKRWNCYSPEAKLEIACNLSASTVGIGGLAKLSPALSKKFAEIASLRKIQELEKNGPQFSKKAQSFVGEVTSNEIQNNPQLAIWKYQRTDITKATALEEKVTRSLLESDIINSQKMGQGIYQAELVTLKDGTRGIWKPDSGVIQHNGMGVPFWGNANSEVATSVVNQKLGIDLVPITVLRTKDGKKGSLQLYIDKADNVKYEPYPQHYSFFDELLGNADRHDENVLSYAGHPVAIDNSFALKDVKHMAPFRISAHQTIDDFKKATTSTEKELARNSVRYLLPEKKVIENLRNTTPQEWSEMLTPYVPKEKIKTFLERRTNLLATVQKLETQMGPDIYPEAGYSPLMKFKKPNKPFFSF